MLITAICGAPRRSGLRSANHPALERSRAASVQLTGEQRPGKGSINAQAPHDLPVARRRYGGARFLPRRGEPAGQRRHRPAPAIAGAAAAMDPDGRGRACDRLAGRRQAGRGRGLGGRSLRRGPRPSALALRAAERRRAGRRDQRTAAARTQTGLKGLGHEDGHEVGRRRRAERRTASRCCATPTATAWPRRDRRSSAGSTRRSAWR